jgi:hypothetical protein
MFLPLISFIVCVSTLISANPALPQYATEIEQYQQSLPADYTFYPATASEKLFRDIFSMATLPYTQPITALTAEHCPLLTKLITTLSEQYQIDQPLLFFANDTTTKHIDIKLCVFNNTSAILIHPTTVTALSPRIFDRYVEQAIMRIASSMQSYKKYRSHQTKKAAIYAAVSGVALAAAGALVTYFNKQESRRAINAGVAATLGIGYGALLFALFKQKHAGFSFQRISSFHNAEQAREDYFPLPDSNQQPTFTSNPSELFGLDAILQTQEYLRTRNTQFAELEKLDLEKPEESTGDDSYYQKVESLRQKINQTNQKRKKSTK